MTDESFKLSQENLGKMVEEVGAAKGPGSAGWDASTSMTRQVNAAVIAELRAGGGSLSEDLQAATGPLLILTTVGAKTGELRAVPLGYLRVEGRLLVIGSMAGSTRNPPWYYNLVSNPRVVVELNGEKFDADAQVLEGVEREQMFESVCAVAPVYGHIQASVERKVPVVVLNAV